MILTHMNEDKAKEVISLKQEFAMLRERFIDLQSYTRQVENENYELQEFKRKVEEKQKKSSRDHHQQRLWVEEFNDFSSSSPILEKSSVPQVHNRSEGLSEIREQVTEEMRTHSNNNIDFQKTSSSLA